MSSNWPIARISEIAEVTSSKRIKRADYVESGVPFFRSKEVIERAKGNEISTELFITEEQFKEIKVKFGAPEAGDILLTSVGTLGVPYQVKPTDRFYFKDGNLTWFRKFKDCVEPEFLLYWLQSPSAQRKLDEVSIGSTQRALTIAALKSLEVPLPPKPIQLGIVQTLRHLNNKLDVNRKINQTLEQMAQAIFKSWFVDFEPVKAKVAAHERWHALQPGNESASPACYAGELAGQPINIDLYTYMSHAAMQAISGMDAEQLALMQVEKPEEYAELYATAELFPSAMQDSELGEIPEGWEVNNIGDEVTVVGGGTPSTKNTDFWESGSVHWTTPKDLSNLADKVLLDTERKITRAGLAKISSGLLPVDTVLMSSRAPVGYLALAKIPVAVNQGYIAMKCEGRLSPEFVIQWCCANMSEIEGRASGTTFAEISKKNFNVIPVIVPVVGDITAYSSYVSKLYNEITVKAHESRTLAGIRDTLLPKLLSGELSVTDIETEVCA